jgi:hypothetical protein
VSKSTLGHEPTELLLSPVVGQSEFKGTETLAKAVHCLHSKQKQTQKTNLRFAAKGQERTSTRCGGKLRWGKGLDFADVSSNNA